MAPSADNLSKKLGRSLQIGDLLIYETLDHRGIVTNVKYFEVVDPNKKGFPNPKDTLIGRLERRLFPSVQRDCVEVRELTSNGPVEKTRLFPKSRDMWSNMIRKENRTETSKSKERA